MLTARKAVRAVKQYIESLDVPYRASYRLNDSFENPYYVWVYLKDDNRTRLRIGIFVGSDDSHSNPPAREEIIAAMEAVPQHYVTIRTADAQTAKRLAQELYKTDGVLSVEGGLAADGFYYPKISAIHRSFLDASAKLYEFNRTKKKEKQRRDILEDIPAGKFWLAVK